jgi:hypothetical protein
VSNFNQFLFRRCKRFSPNFNTIDLAVRELHLLEVVDVVVEFMEIFLGQSPCSFISNSFSSQIHG